MANTAAVRNWYFIHKWSSLACTIFLLLLCLTGLPLIFSEELSDLLGPAPAYSTVPENTPALSLDVIAQAAKARYPGDIIVSVFLDEDEPAVVVNMAPSWKALQDAPASAHWTRFDARTAKVVEDSSAMSSPVSTFLETVRQLHVELFAGLPGMLFLGAMGLLFILATVSGIALYGPYMKNMRFGTVRHGKSRRVRWLDVHNLLGIGTLVWALVVGFTGALNEVASPLFNHWQRTDVAAVLRGVADGAPIDQARASSLQGAVATVQSALPDSRIFAILYPGARFGGPGHYLVVGKGNTPLTSRLLNPALVDAHTGELTAVVSMPWYLRALEVSRPLHFGDYGGMPLKTIWGVLDLITIVVLATGLYLWFARRGMNARNATQQRRRRVPSTA